MKEKLALLLIICLVGAFILSSGCASQTPPQPVQTSPPSVANRDQELLNAVFEGTNKLVPLVANFKESAASYDLSAIRTAGQNLENESRTQYNKIIEITPVSTDLSLTKQKYLNAMEQLEVSGRSAIEGVDAFNNGDFSTATTRFKEASRSLEDASNSIFEAGGAIPERFKPSTTVPTPVSINR
jgi:hypothetical protein